MNIGPVKINVRQAFNASGKAARGNEEPTQDAAGIPGAEKKETARKGLEIGKRLHASELTEAEFEKVKKLKQVDTAVRAHEMAHVVSGGRYVRSGAKFQFERGPDGKAYAVAGEVGIDISAVPGDPRATVEKMQTVQRAALAPTDPSAQDRRVAAKAAQIQADAALEMVLMRLKESDTQAKENTVYQSHKSEKAYAADGKTNATGTIIHMIG